MINDEVVVGTVSNDSLLNVFLVQDILYYAWTNSEWASHDLLTITAIFPIIVIFPITSIFPLTFIFRTTVIFLNHRDISNCLSWTCIHRIASYEDMSWMDGGNCNNQMLRLFHLNGIIHLIYFFLMRQGLLTVDTI